MFEKDRKTDRQNFFNLRPRTYGDEKENSSVFLSLWLKISTNSCTYQKKIVPLQRKGRTMEDIVDFWTLVDNACNPRRVIATDGSIINVELYNKIEAYVKH